MKTKKDILKWWEKLGDYYFKHNDKKDFIDNIDKDLMTTWTSVGLKKPMIKATIMNPNSWKYPIRLYFYNQDCIRIVGF